MSNDVTPVFATTAERHEMAFQPCALDLSLLEVATPVNRVTASPVRPR